MADAGLGDGVRIMNLQSNRIVDAIVTGPGAASANQNASF
jgi:flagella basal body P-ring formation protein FlgA